MMFKPRQEITLQSIVRLLNRVTVYATAAMLVALTLTTLFIGEIILSAFVGLALLAFILYIRRETRDDVRQAQLAAVPVQEQPAGQE